MFPQNVFMVSSFCMAKFPPLKLRLFFFKYVSAPIHSFSYAWKSVVSWKADFINWDFTSILNPFETFFATFPVKMTDGIMSVASRGFFFF